MNFIKNMLSSISGDVSSKRVITILSSFTLIAVAYLNMIWKLHIDDNILECLKWVSGGGLVTIASERFGNKPYSSPDANI
jgi:hypothetical protein